MRTDWPLLKKEDLDLKTYARLMELEYRCERCHRRYATEMFDRQFVCSPCRRTLERETAERG